MFIFVQADRFQPKTNYCTISRQHIGCNHKNVSKTNKCDTSNGGGAFYLSHEERLLILKEHNIYRNDLAGGNINDYPVADHMPEITWDAELEYLAALHTQRCKFDHDTTRATTTFKHAGQCIAEVSTSDSYSEKTPGIKKAVLTWFVEYEYSKRLQTPETMNNVCFVAVDGKQIGHFTAMSTDKTNKIGCAGLKYKKFNKTHMKKMFVFNIVCNYSYTNMKGEQTYVAGKKKPGAGCKKGTSGAYPNLCKTTEPVEAIPNAPKKFFHYYNGAGQQFETLDAAKRTNLYPVKTQTIFQYVHECPAKH